MSIPEHSRAVTHSTCPFTRESSDLVLSLEAPDSTNHMGRTPAKTSWCGVGSAPRAAGCLTLSHLGADSSPVTLQGTLGVSFRERGDRGFSPRATSPGGAELAFAAASVSL